ncbi:hypothetical protein DS745_18040 [Anaerobacillus alkaliphilus]|uniref:Competence protein CoiA n=1 Tax=Anaerobacillus alkaliphilus TaxID=1548597 RepID=A0A4Q0VP70_9BACI|nr:competence protein CoiA family protein [Anaerobacillus alkaliphilus]RXI98236.1 hypothetical protein DS745_18040 [Anaerobacillus alkaliphilus]
MLVALTKDGTPFSLVAHQYEKKELLKFRGEKSFFCPACGQEVILKLGSKHAWHFAHKQALNCTVEMEGETLTHLDGKKLLFDWLFNQGLTVSLEPYLKDIKQRPDLLVTIHKKTYVIEFQCSNISPQIFYKRTETYQKNNYIPVWILGSNQLKRAYRNVYRLSSFHWLFAHTNLSSIQLPQIISFCPQSKNFLFLRNLLALSTSRTATTQVFIPLNKCTFQEFLTPGKPALDYVTWSNTKQNWRIYSPKCSTAELFVRKLFLQKGLSFMLFSPTAGVPVPYHHFIETPTYIWQSWISIVFIFSRNIGESIHVNLVIRAFQTLVRKGIFHIRLLPLENNERSQQAIHEYLKFLVSENLLFTTDHQHYRILKEINFPRNLEEAARADRKVMEYFIQAKY